MLQVIREAIQSRKVVLSDLRQNGTNSEVRLEVVVPLFADADLPQGAAIGALVLEIDPRQYLFPLLESWPTLSRTAETLLAELDGNEVVYWNELQHSRGEAFPQRLPVGMPGLITARFLTGEKGTLEGVDYRGVPVVAVGRRIPGTRWTMIAKIDTSELYAEAWEQIGTAILLPTTVLLTFALVVVLLWRQRDARFAARELAFHKQAQEQALLQTSALQAAANSIVITGPDGVIRWVNDAFTKLTGYNAGEVIGRNPRILKSGKHGPEFYKALWECILAGRTWHDEVVNRRKDGSLYTEEMTITPVKDAAGITSHFIAIKQDVTERKQAEAALREAAETMTAAQRIARFGSWELELTNPDFEQNALRWSEECYRLFGFEPYAVPVTKELFYRHVPEEERDRIKNAVSKAMTDGADYSIDHRVLLPDGEVRHVHEQARMFIDPRTGRPLKLVGTVHDITERVQAHELLRQSNEALELKVAGRTEEIRRLNDELRLRLAQLETANKELESFAYSVSHDLRTPLRSIDGFSKALLEDCWDKLDDDGKDHLRSVCAASQRMAQLIEDLLGLSRVTRTELRLRTFDLAALARAIISTLRASEPQRGVEAVIPDSLTVRADANLIRIALENLLANAWKFSSQKPQARIELGQVEQNGQNAYFVRDNGAGFEMAYAHKLFGAFQRLHSTEEFPGTGVGLATVQRIIHRHGGKVWAEGKPNGGACFYFTLPSSAEPPCE